MTDLKTAVDNTAKQAVTAVETGATNIVKRNAKWFALGAAVLLVLAGLYVYLHV